MRILQVIPTLEAGGAEGFVANLGASLAELGAEVKFFLMAGVRGERGRVLHDRLETAGVEVIGHEEHNVRSPRNVTRLARLIRTWRPEVVQANMYTAEVLVAAARPLAVGRGGSYVRRLANTEQAGYRMPTLVRAMDRVFNQTIACSDAVADAYTSFIGENHRSALVTIANGGLLQSRVTTEKERIETRRTLGLPASGFVVVHIGRMFGGDRSNSSLATGQKGQDILLEAFAKAFSDAPDAHLLLVGDGPLRPDAETLATRLGIARQTRFLGQIPQPWPALRAGDLFFFPSRYEGLPNVLPEAASCGLPVMASDIPEIRSLAPSEGWLLRPADDVDAFATGLRSIRNDARKFLESARRVAPDFRQQFSMTTCAQRYLHAYANAARG